MCHRIERIAHELLAKLSIIMRERVSDPRLADVTLVEVRPAPDVSFARVFYRCLSDRNEVDLALTRAKPFIRRCLAETLSLRRVPELDFRYDPAQERAQRIESILHELSREGDER